MIKKILVSVVMAVAVLGTAACTGDTTPATKETPQACIDALDAAEELVSGPMVEQTEASIVLSGLIPMAFEAGATGDSVAAQNIITTMETVTAEAEARAVEVETLVDEYNKSSGECRDLTSGTNA